MNKFTKRFSSQNTESIWEKLNVAYGYDDFMSLGSGVPAAPTFPVSDLKRMVDEIFDEAQDPQSDRQVFSYMFDGHPRLVKALEKRYMGKFKSGNPETDELQIFNGASQAVDFISRAFLDAGDTVIVEEFSYGGSMDIFRAYEANVVSVPIDEDGMLPEILEEKLKTEKNVKLIYLIPTFSNPTGIQMSLERRKAVYELAVKYDVMILEDSPYFELRLSGDYIPTIKSMDTEGKVIFAGSLSKTICPGVRLGFAIGPKAVMDVVDLGRQTSDMSGTGLIQLAVAKYLEECDIDEHIAECCDLYRVKRDAMLAALEREMGGLASWTKAEGGFFIFVTLPENIPGNEFAVYAAANKHVIIYPGSDYHPQKKNINKIRLNYSVPSVEQIDDGIKRLGDALKEMIAAQK